MCVTVSRAAVPETVIYGSLRGPEILSRNSQNQNCFHNKTLFAFLTLILSQVYDGVFQSLYDLRCHNRLKQEAAMWIQLSPIKLDMKEICKNVILLFLLNFVLESIFSTKLCIYVNT